MTDLTQYNDGNAFDANETESTGKGLEPGRYTMHFAGDEIITGKNNWVALKTFFEIDGSTIVMNTTFTLGSDNPKAVEIGDISLKLLLKAMGVTSMKNTDELVGKSCLLYTSDAATNREV